MTPGIIPNLGFEAELAGRSVPAVVSRQAARFAHVLRLVPGFDDAVPFRENHDRVVAWGWSGVARSRAGTAAASWPPIDLVRWANDKRTSHAIELQLGVALPGAAVVESTAELTAATGAIDGSWVAKDPWGVAGRGQIVDDHGRAKRLLDETGGLVVEPWCTDLKDFSIHLDVSADAVVLVGVCELLTDRSGTFRGNRYPGRAPEATVAAALDAGQMLRDRGWRGPVGIDGFEAVLNDQPVVRAICEINARWSFGRLTIELARRLRSNDLSWHHPPRSAAVPAEKIARIGCGSGNYLLPEHYDPGARSGTYLTVHGHDERTLDRS